MTAKPKKPAKKPAAKKPAAKPKKPELPSLEDIVEMWVSMQLDEDADENGMANTVEDGWRPLTALQVGDELDGPLGVKIAYDGRSEYDDKDDYLQDYSFAVYIREKSLEEPFPPHESAYGMVLHRPDEVCVWVWVSPDGSITSVNAYEAIVNDGDKPKGTYEKFEAIAQAIYQRDRKQP